MKVNNQQAKQIALLRKQQNKLIRDLHYIKNLCDHADEHCSWQNAIAEIAYAVKNSINTYHD